MDTTTIAAIATAPGRGAIGIVRLSGHQALAIAARICGKPLSPRTATLVNFHGVDNSVIDSGLAIYFKAPHSFTGEDCVEFQGHGGPVILDQLLEACCRHGAVLARPGQFSERAFLNDKIDLAQAEAIADLIDASSRQSAANALHSLQGVFSTKVNALADGMMKLRLYVEAAIDFPEEEIDFLSDQRINQELSALLTQTQELLSQSQQGALLRDGIQVVIAGLPNAGKSSLLNYLSQKDSAIVTDIAGTTRDILREYIHIDGLPLHIIDTAGLRDNPDAVEAIGIQKAQAELAKADVILWLVDSSIEPEKIHDFQFPDLWPDNLGPPPPLDKIIVVFNKIDTSGFAITPNSDVDFQAVAISATTGAGIDSLKQAIKDMAGLQPESGGGFTARRRHLDSLQKCLSFLEQAEMRLKDGAGELMAEDLRLAQQHLGEITGQVTADDLLGEIFSSFCIGK